MSKIKRLLLAILIVFAGLTLVGIVCWISAKCPEVALFLIGIGVICFLIKVVYDGLKTIDEAEQEIEDNEFLKKNRL